MQTLDTLNDKLDLLIKKYTSLQIENKRQAEEIIGLNKTIDVQIKKIKALEEDMVSVRLDKVEINDEDKDNMRKQLDNVINEIDKILVTLND